MDYYLAALEKLVDQFRDNQWPQLKSKIRREIQKDEEIMADVNKKTIEYTNQLFCEETNKTTRPVWALLFTYEKNPFVDNIRIKSRDYYDKLIDDLTQERYAPLLKDEETIAEINKAVDDYRKELRTPHLGVELIKYQRKQNSDLQKLLCHPTPYAPWITTDPPDARMNF